jgi:hypothetical protein
LREGQKKPEAAERKKREKKGKKGGEINYSCLMNEEGIVIVKFEVLLFIMLTFLLK